MQKCENCSADVFAGQGCISCGHITLPDGPPADEMTADAQSPTETPVDAAGTSVDDLFAGVEGSKASPLSGKVPAIVGAVVVVALLAFGATQFLGASEESVEAPSDAPSDSLAFADDEAPGAAANDNPASYCDSPSPNAEAPQPSATEPNLFLTFVQNSAAEWDTPSDAPFDAGYFSSRSEMLELEASPTSEASYVMCIAAEATGDDRLCRLYDAGARHTVSGTKYSVAVYEIASATLVVDGPIRSLPKACPEQLTEQNGATNQAPNLNDAAMWAVDHAMPGRFTTLNLTRALHGGSPGWCSSPSAQSDAGQAATGPGVFVLGGDPSKVTGAEHRASLITHVACFEFSPISEMAVLCEFSLGQVATVKGGSYAMTVIDLATGEALAGQNFVAEPGCPSEISGDLSTMTAPIPDAAYGFLNATIANVTVAPAAADSAAISE